MLRYRNPKDVKSPRDMIRDLKVRFDGGAENVSIAEMRWGNNPKVIGMRWNASMREQENDEKLAGRKECLGMPVSSANPVWFILPDDLFEENSELWQTINRIREERQQQ